MNEFCGADLSQNGLADTIISHCIILNTCKGVCVLCKVVLLIGNSTAFVAATRTFLLRFFPSSDLTSVGGKLLLIK